MKCCVKCGEHKPLDAFHKQSRSSDGKHPWCKPCNLQHVAAWRAADPARAKRSSAAWRANNPERAKQSDAERYARTAEKQRLAAAARRDPEKAKQTSAAWRAADPERARRADAEWRAANPAKCRAKKAARRAATIRAVPAWFGELDRLVELEAADLCVRREAATGIKWELDHVVPLRGKTVCGLHTAANFAVVPAAYNNRKGNRTWPDRP